MSRSKPAHVCQNRFEL
ncbi:hypothetical protein CP02DC21_1552A, partial [Chlamydia psittaci 02DC21]